MLEIQNYWEKMVNSFAFDNEKRLVNMQDIKQKLLELAVRNTVMYSTDIIYLINGLEDYFVDLKVKEIDIYFKKTGIDWFLHNEELNYNNRPEFYRYLAKLVRKDGSITLYYGLGNC